MGRFRRTLTGIEPGTARLMAARPINCYYGNNAQSHSILRLFFVQDTVSQFPVTEPNSLCGHGPVTVLFFDLGHFRSEGRLSDYLLRFVQEFCLVLYDLK